MIFSVLFYTNATYISMCRQNTLPGKHSTFPWMNFFSFFRLIFFWYFQWTKPNKTNSNWHKFRQGQKRLFTCDFNEWDCKFFLSFYEIFLYDLRDYKRSLISCHISFLALFFYRTILFSVLSASGVIIRWWRNFKNTFECTFPVHFWASGSKSRKNPACFRKWKKIDKLRDGAL